MPKQQGRDVIKAVIEDLEDCEELNDWEESFVRSQRRRLDSGQSFTDDQVGKLWEIHDERCN